MTAVGRGCGAPRRAVFWIAAWVFLAAASGARAETDWVLVLDRSQSMVQNDPRNYRFDAQKILAQLLSLGVGESHRLTIVRFAGTAEAVLKRQEIRPETLDAIRQAIVEDRPEGDTDLGAALELARKTVAPEGRSSDVKVVLLSDGVLAGRIPGLHARLEAEKRAFEELGLPVHVIILNDFALPEADRQRLRGLRYHYEDKTLHEGEDVMRDLARKTGGRAAQVLPGRNIEDILLDLVAPYMSFHREAITGRIRTFPTDRQLFLLVNRSSGDLKLRFGTREIAVDLGREQTAGGEFPLLVSPYSNKTVIMARPAEGTRWPEWVDVLPGSSGRPVDGEIFVVSNVRLYTVQGSAVGSADYREGVKSKVLENEVYPMLFRIWVAEDLSADRRRSVFETLKDASIRVAVSGADGRRIAEESFPAGEIASGLRTGLYLLPTALRSEGGASREPSSLVLNASLEGAGEPGQRSIARAPQRSFIVTPSPFEWTFRRNWRGDAESASRLVTERSVELELGQEFRLEVVRAGEGALGEVEILADFSKAGEAAARRLKFADAGGVPQRFQTEWIFPQAPGEYAAKLTIKSSVVQEVSYAVSAVRDDFRPAGARYGPDGKDTAAPGDLGSFVCGEKIEFSRPRTIDRLSPEATSAYWARLAQVPARAHILRKDPSGGAWAAHRTVPLEVEAPTLGTAAASARYRGEVADLEPGEYLVSWPENRPLIGDPASDPRSDRFRVLGRPFAVQVLGEDGAPLAAQDGKPVHLAGKKLLFKVVPTETFPKDLGGEVVGTLTWARKDVGGPQVVQASKRPDGAFVGEFPTTDFHTGAARLRVKLSWKTDGRARSVEEEVAISSVPKALGVAVEPVTETIFIGESEAKIRFRVRAVGGQDPQMQRDLLSLWLTQRVNVTIGESPEFYRVELRPEGDSLTGSLDAPSLPEGSYKLVVNSPVAKLGQDIGACFFAVRPAPYQPRVYASANGTDARMVLDSSAAEASARGDGVLWVALEPVESEDAKPAKLVSAAVVLDGREVAAKWRQEGERGLRSERIALEDFPERSSVAVRAADAEGRKFEWSLGTLRVEPVPLSPAVVWAALPPAEMGRGTHCAVRGFVRIRGGSREERAKAAQALRDSAATEPFLATRPPSAFGGLQLVPLDSVPSPEAPAAAGEGEPSDVVLGERVAFEAKILLPAGDPSLEDRVYVSVRFQGKTIDERRISVGPSPARLVVGRPQDADAGLAGEPAVEITAKERVRAALERRDGRDDVKPKIEVFGPAAPGAPAVRPIVSVESGTAEWSPRAEGEYRVVAELSLGPDCGWAAEERLVVGPPVRLEWAQAVDSTVRLDAGQHLPLVVRVLGPAKLDVESLVRIFELKPEALGEGAQPIAVEFSGWEEDPAAGGAGLVVKAISAKPIPAEAARVRVSIRPRGDAADATPLASVDLQIVRSGGSIVVVENFERGESGYVLRDVVPGYRVPRNATVRFGYRPGSPLAETATIKNRISASVVPVSGGPEKLLDVLSVGREVVVFTPYQATKRGKYRVQVEIKGEMTQLKQAPEFEVTPSFGDSVRSALAYALGLVALAAAVVLARIGVAYQKDRAAILERVEARKAKALEALREEPSDRLRGEVKLQLGGRQLGPLDLNRAASQREVAAWVDQHFSSDPAIFADPEKNRKRRPLTDRLLAAARTELLAEVEKTLPVRAADLCLRDAGGGVHEADLVFDAVGSEHPGMKTVLTLRLLEGGKIRVSAPAGKTATLERSANLPFNGWVGKTGDQIRVSVKVPGFADYSTVTIDLA